MTLIIIISFGYAPPKTSVEQRLTLVQGPPGTGKTAVAVRIVTSWVRSRAFGHNAGILCCSDSNIAVDNLLEGLVNAGVRAVRLGRPENTRPDLLRYSFDEMVNQALGPLGSAPPDPQARHKVHVSIALITISQCA